MVYEVTIAGRTRRVEVESLQDGRFQVVLDGAAVAGEWSEPSPHLLALRMEGRSASFGWKRTEEAIELSSRGLSFSAQVVDERARKLRALVGGKKKQGQATVRSAMPGKVVSVLVTHGQEVVAGTGLLVVEAMKMENEVKAPSAGRVTRIAVAPQDTVEAGQILVELSPLGEEK